MWTLYDRLISRAAEDDVISEYLPGTSWTMVATKGGHVGVAATQPTRTGKYPEAAQVIGMSLKKAAALVKSWDFGCAAVGLAAINACCNRAELFADDGESADAFIRFKDRVAGKKVAVIGRFAYLESRLNGLCDMYVLERLPGENDYPDPACEYLLPLMDAVFITGSATANKTMPRLLELSKNAMTVVAGPSTSMDEAFFEMGADALCGFCVTDKDECARAASNCVGIFTCGKMVCVEKRAGRREI